MEITSLKVKRASALADAVHSGGASAAAALATLLEECKKDLSEGKELHDKISDGRDPRCSAAYYRAACEYHKVRGPAHLFYENALLLLGSTPLADLSAEDKVSLAVDIAVAALVGDGVYNFGEVNSHPILQSLHATEHEWLISLLSAFQTGNIDAFNTVVASNRAAFSAQSALESSGAVIKEKITLLAVMELAASKPAADRAISFAEISHETRLPADQVEWLLMRAMSLGLIRGKIDEVEQSVNVTFVKPRVLNLQQIGELKERLDGWREKARTSLLFVEDHSRDIIS
jgi:26S proteasome regulatory subunit N9